MTYWGWLLDGARKKLWWKAVLFALLGMGTALVAMWAEMLFPWEVPWDISRDAVSSLLGVISSSMLAVTTFSVGAMTTAFGAASSGVTPRATVLLIEDPVTHNVLSSFIGAFVFSIIGTIVLHTGSYGERGRAVLFVITIFVLVLIVTQLLRWINHLMSYGRSAATIERVEQTARAALEERLQVPYLGANPWHEDAPLPATAHPIAADCVGYVQFIDIAALSALCEAHGLEAWLPQNTGSFVYDDQPLVWVAGPLTEALISEIRDQFVIASSRKFEQDPRFGLAVMAEIGSQALSSATNDAGTALEVIGRLTRLLSTWAEGREDAPVQYPRLHLRPLSDSDLFDDAFMIMGRDGGHLIEVQLRLQKSLLALQRIGGPKFRQAAASHIALMQARARDSGMQTEDLQRLQAEIEHVRQSPRARLSLPDQASA